MTQLRVLAFGAWDRGAGYPRGDALIAGLRRHGATVDECHFELPYSRSEKRRLITSPWLWPGYWLALRRARHRARVALRDAIVTHRPDVVLVPYPGHLVVRWARSVWHRRIVLDLFLSAYDTAVVDRELFDAGSLCAGFLRRLDRRACEAADCSLVDTDENADYVADLVGLPRRRFATVHVADPAEVDSLPPYEPPCLGDKLEVLFFGTGVPLHGLDHLLHALLHCTGVRLTLIGGRKEDRDQARALPSQKIRVLDEFVPPEELRRHLAKTHLVAGVFGTSPKADRVIPFKVMQGLAAGRPVITGDTSAIRSVLRNGENGILVPCGDSRALADALQSIVDDPACLPPLADAAFSAYLEHFSLDRTGRALYEICVGTPAVEEVPSVEVEAPLSLS